MSQIQKTKALVAASFVLAFGPEVMEDLRAAQAETKDPLAKVVVNVTSAQAEGTGKRLLEGAPLIIDVSVVPVLYPKVKRAREVLEERRRKYKAAGLTEDQMQGLLAPYRDAKELAAMKVAPLDLGKGWQQQVRFEIARQDRKKTKVLTKVDWRRYLHRYDAKQHVLTEEPCVTQWQIPPEVARPMMPGTYELKAMVGKMTSQPLRVVVQKPHGREDETELAIRLCKFYTDKGSPDEAIGSGLRVLPSAAPPKLAIALRTEMGNAYRAKREWANALDHYEKALTLWKTIHPGRQTIAHPEVLLLRIDEMHTKLDAEKKRSGR